MQSRRRSRNFVAAFALVFLLFTAAFGGLAFFFEPIDGDMARLGHWSERDFGWHSLQPPVPLRRNGPTLAHPRTLVLGDSFSRTNIWQSYLTEDIDRVLSYYYEDVGCIDNWAKWVMRKPSKSVETVIIEVVERDFVQKFSSLQSCPETFPKPFEITGGTFQPQRTVFPSTLDLEFLLRIAVNSWQMSEAQGELVSDKVINVPLTTDALFSSRRSDRLLFYRNDQFKGNWTETQLLAAARSMKALQDGFELAGIYCLIVVIPDKSTVYGPYFASAAAQMKYPLIMKELAAQQVDSIDLLKLFQARLPGMVDLYYPNDSHLSARGYQILAAAVDSRLATQRQHDR